MNQIKKSYSIESVITDENCDLEWVDEIINEYDVNEFYFAPIFKNGRMSLSEKNQISLETQIREKRRKYNYKKRFYSNLISRIDYVFNKKGKEELFSP